jgi:hypothetical protein
MEKLLLQVISYSCSSLLLFKVALNEGSAVIFENTGNLLVAKSLEGSKFCYMSLV